MTKPHCNPPFYRGLSVFAKTSLADGPDLDVSAAETKNRQKPGLVTFLTVSSVRGGCVPSLSSDSAVRLLSFTIRWGIVQARVRRYPLAGAIG